MMSFIHTTQYLLVSGQPCECLLSTHEVIFWMRFFYTTRMIFLQAFLVCVILYMKAVNDLRHFVPHLVIRWVQGKVFPCCY